MLKVAGTRDDLIDTTGNPVMQFINASQFQKVRGSLVLDAYVVRGSFSCPIFCSGFFGYSYSHVSSILLAESHLPISTPCRPRMNTCKAHANEEYSHI